MALNDRHGLRLGQEVNWAGYRWKIDGFVQGGYVFLRDMESPAITRCVLAFQLNAPQ